MPILDALGSAGPSGSGGLGALIAQLLTSLVTSGAQHIQGLLDGYLRTTSDPSHPGLPLTANPSLAGINRDVSLAGDSLLALVVIALSARAILDRGIGSQHDLRAALPRVLVAVVLMHASLTLAQMAIDLNNALSGFASGLGGGGMPWSGPLSSSALSNSSLAADLFEVLVLLALMLALAVLGFVYVIRMAVLQVLVAIAPIAALALILPATRGFARVWCRLFTVVLFMQAGQVLVLSVVTAAGLVTGSGLQAAICAFATLWVTLRVPSFLAAAFDAHGSVAGVVRSAVARTRLATVTV